MRAFAPANISCIFQMYEDPDPAKMGSYGLGFTVNDGVTVEVSLTEKTEIFFNGEKIIFPTVETVVKNLISLILPNIPTLKVTITSPLPLGCGFGLSGASALATAYALDDVLHLKKTKLELAKIAHIAEVENKTGLGDVTNQYFGGFLLKTVPSSHFKAQRIPITNIPVYCKYFSEIATNEIIVDKNMKNRINKAGKEALKKVRGILPLGGVSFKQELFAKLISISKEFAENSRLLKDKQVVQTIQEIESRGGHASMIMLGNAVFSDIPFEGARELIISNTPAKVS